MFSIRTKLTLALLAVLLPQLVLGWVNIRDRAELQSVLVARNQASIAQGVAASLDTSLIDILRTTEVTGNFIIAGNTLGTAERLGTADVSDYLRTVRARQPHIQSMILLAPDGTVIAADPRELAGQNLAGRADIAPMLQANNTPPGLSISSLINGPVPYFAVSVALRLNGQLIGIISSAVDTGLIGDIVRAPLAGTDDVALVLDGDGRIIYLGTSKGEIALPWSERDFSSQNEQLFSGNDVKLPHLQESYLGTQRLTRIANWSAGVYSPVNEAFDQVNMQTRRDLAVLGGVTLLTLLLIIWLGNLLTRPVLALTAQAERLRSGDLSHTITLATHDEFSRLGEIFNQMAASLNETINQLRQARDQVAHQAVQLQQLLLRTNTIQEEERKRLSFEIHDGVIQTIIAAKFEMQAASRNLAENPEKAGLRLRTALGLVDQSIGELRQVVFDLRPTYLDSTGLVAAIEKFMETYEGTGDIPAEVTSEGTPFDLPNDVKIALYRIVQEAMSNVLKHADATAASVHISYGTPDEQGIAPLSLVIEDNGRGFDPASVNDGKQNLLSGHLGLSSMEERAQSIGGSFRLDSAPDRGTRISVQVPVKVLGVETGRAS